MATSRSFPFIWVTWLSGLLSGDRHCWWSSWFKAHIQGYEKIGEDAENESRLAKWKAEHAEFVSNRARVLTEEGWRVYVEDQNKFFLKGKVATLSGCPDIVAVRDNDTPTLFRAIALDGVTESGPAREALVEECKTGKQRDSDRWQAFIYMLALPQTHDAVKGRTLRGAVVYGDAATNIPATFVGEVKHMIVAGINKIASTPSPERVPSAAECSRCDIAACPDRATGESIETETDDF